LYTPSSFQQEDINECKKLIANSPLATVVALNDNQIQAHHLPLKWVETDSEEHLLEGHIAIANPLHKQVMSGSPVLVIFHGPDAYVSPSWYPSKAKNPKVVPTWNYMTVHVRGEINFIQDAAWKLGMLERITNKMESKVSESWKISDAPSDYIQKQLNGIIGIKVGVDSIEGKWKLSQNKSIEDRKGVIEGLSEEGDTELTLEMEKLNR